MKHCQQNQLKAFSLSASIRHVYRHLLFPENINSDLGYHVSNTGSSCRGNTCSKYNRFLDDSKAATSSLDGSVSVSPLSYNCPRPETSQIVNSTQAPQSMVYVSFYATMVQLQATS